MVAPHKLIIAKQKRKNCLQVKKNNNNTQQYSPRKLASSKQDVVQQQQQRTMSEKNPDLSIHLVPVAPPIRCCLARIVSSPSLRHAKTLSLLFSCTISPSYFSFLPVLWPLHEDLNQNTFHSISLLKTKKYATIKACCCFCSSW